MSIKLNPQHDTYVNAWVQELSGLIGFDNPVEVSGIRVTLTKTGDCMCSPVEQVIEKWDQRCPIHEGLKPSEQ